MPEKEHDHDPGDDKDVTVLAWLLTESTWKRIKSVVSDPDGICDSYHEWLDRENQNRAKNDHKGYKVVTMEVDVEGTLAWCKEKKQPVNLKSFSKFRLQSFAKNKSV